MSKSPATPLILAALKRGDGITAQDARDRWGTMRLASIIFNLKKRGYDIITIMHRENGGKYAEYRMVTVS
ncbi:hypothetical protein XMV225_000823 [Aliiroseovarius sp. xm-v-225]|uniref:helix-turn-helix domain-containing protein n=1 Tax=unclassified Aliiroseovarius TaxID=2623558 RepID=UPI0015680C85|nr:MULTISPECIES: helix-turn-helix domain-containing protein [unclassified Aliiroseovarius]NRP43667.1 hypothetical protein [Aliiroseovarius sp. xm-m-378]NRP64538.1 hypothetical protein [Aliiroseovarius sp. xm-v-225]NRP92297.1 hypothetical protein [Aliiroseovarius sp. xm-a-134]